MCLQDISSAIVYTSACLIDIWLNVAATSLSYDCNFPHTKCHTFEAECHLSGEEAQLCDTIAIVSTFTWSHNVKQRAHRMRTMKRGEWRCFWEAFCLSAAQVLLLSFLFALTSYESQSHFSHLIIAVQPSLFVLRAKIPRRNVYQIRKFNCMHISLLREAFLAHTNDNIKLNRTMTIWRLLTANEMKWN